MTAMIVVVAVFIVVFGYAGYLLYFQDGVYPGVTVAGIDVKGLSKSEVVLLLDSGLNDLIDSRSVEVEIDGAVTTITAADAGGYYDVSTSAAEAYKYGRTGSTGERLGKILKAKFSGYEIPVKFNYDAAKLEAIGTELESSVNSDFRQSSYEVTSDSVIIDNGQEGSAIVGGSIAELIIDKFESGSKDRIVVTTTVTRPDAIDLYAIKDQVEREPVNAVMTIDAATDTFTITSEQNGIAFDINAAQQLLSASDGSCTIPLTIIEPEITKASLEATLFTDTLAEVSTKLNAGNKPRTTNVQLACKYVNGTILLPGEEFSYNNVVGERTYERGFKDAKIYAAGEVVDGVGGGICQVSSTLYMAALRSDLEITSRRNHRFTVDYTPLGEDATVVYGSVDFKFVNNTDYPIKILCEQVDSQVNVTFLGYKNGVNKEVKIETKVLSKDSFETVDVPDESVPQGERKLKNGGYTGYKTESYRVVYIDGKEVSRTLENKSTYTRLDKTYLVNPTDYENAQNPTNNGSTEPVDPSTGTTSGETGTSTPDTGNTGSSTPETPDISQPPEWLQNTIAPSGDMLNSIT